MSGVGVSSGLVRVVFEEEVVAVQLLFLVELGLVLVDTGSVVAGVASESNVQILEEGVAARQEGLWLVGVGVNTRLSVEDNDPVGEVSGHNEVVLDDEGGLLGVHNEALDDAGGDNTLLGVEVGGRLIDNVDISGHTQSQDDGHSLQFTARQMLDFLIDEIITVV